MHQQYYTHFVLELQIAIGNMIMMWVHYFTFGNIAMTCNLNGEKCTASAQWSWAVPLTSLLLNTYYTVPAYLSANTLNL